MSERPAQASGAPAAPGLPTVDVNEYGGKKNDERQTLNRRLFMQLLVFDVPVGTDLGQARSALIESLTRAKVPAVVYADTNAVRGLGLLTWSEDPAHFVDLVAKPFQSGVLATLSERRDFAMLGRTYSNGHEPDLEHALLHRSVENVMHADYGWHIWYPLRRSGAFATLDPHEQSMILREHAAIGMAYGKQELAHDIRLACHGLDAKDNEFVIGVVGPALYPLSHLVQTMRKTKQTSQFISQMGPFFVGKVIARVGA